MTEFKHKAIDLSKTAIRIARLFKGCPTDEVHCGLFEAYLDPDKIVPYAALSYVWGDESEKQEIHIDGKKALVTTNLFEALKSLRDRISDRVLWVDAICIDQSNNEEKGHQVGQMRLVYERAEEVIIWLGKNDARIERLFECAKKLEKAGLERTKPTTTYEDWKMLWESNSKEKERLCYDVAFEVQYREQRLLALQDLLRRPWFKRIWVIQEAASAKRATVRCGGKSVSTRTLAMLPRLMGEKPDSHVQAVLDVMPGPLRSTCTWWNASRDLGTLLTKFGMSESGDPRDAIYALLGISSNFENNPVLSPDYKATFEETVQNTIWALLFGEALDRSRYKLPIWSKTKLLDSLRDLPGILFDWALSVREAHELERLLTPGDSPVGIQASGSNEGRLHHKVPLHSLIQNDGPLSAIQSFMPHADMEINRFSGPWYRQPLHLAAEMGLDSVVSVLLQQANIDVNFRGYGSIVKNMLHDSGFYRKFDIKYPDRDKYGGDTPLNIAVAKGHLAVIKLLLQYRNNLTGVRTEVKNKGWTPLHLAAAVLKDHTESAEVVQCLLQHVDVNATDKGGKTPLNVAVIQGNDCIVKTLLKNKVIDMNHAIEIRRLIHVKNQFIETVGETYTPLQLAVRAKSTSIIEMLIEDGRTDHEIVLSLLKRAVWTGNHDIVRELLAGCSDQDHEVLGQALVRASAYGDLETVRMLLDKGAPTDRHGEPWFRHDADDFQRNMTPLRAAKNSGKEEVVILLLENGVQPDYQTSFFLWVSKVARWRQQLLAWP